MSKMVLYPVLIINAGDMSAATITSLVADIMQVDSACLQINYSGSSPVGTLVVQASLDGANYAPIPVSVGTTAAALSVAIPGATSPILISLSPTTFRYLQVVYTKTSGTGTLSAYLCTKRIGD